MVFKLLHVDLDTQLLLASFGSFGCTLKVDIQLLLAGVF